MACFANGEGRSILLNMVKAIQGHKEYLGEVDGLIGDGDHGMNMNKGFTLYAEELGEDAVTFSDGLFDLGALLLNRIGGSMGPIYGTVFMEMSDAANEAEEIDLPLFTAMMRAGLEGLYDIVDARPGDKTLVDTLHPAVQSLEADARQGTAFRDALANMRAAAEAGWKSTESLVARYGRSARLGERSRGVPDAGATSCKVILWAMAEGIEALLR